MPAKRRVEKYIPTRDEVMAILKAAKGTQYFTPLYLASYGLRFGEILALTLDDIDDESIKVNKSMVHDLDNNLIIKTPKTFASNRIVPVPKEITDKIKRDGVRDVRHILPEVLGTHEDPDTGKSMVNRMLTKLK